MPRCALLSSCTLDLLPDLVNKGEARDWFVAPFNQYAQAILDEQSELYRFAPGVVFLAVAVEDLLEGLPGWWTEAAEERGREANRRLDEWLGLIRHLAGRLESATIFVHNFAVIRPQPHPLLAFKSPTSLAALALRANAALAQLAEEEANVFVADFAGIVAELGTSAVFDARYHYLARAPLSLPALNHLAALYRRLLAGVAGKRKKCLVLDLDNTLWGGTVGEDGPDHLVLGSDGPGRAFQDMQRHLLDLRAAGTLLAVCSKNDEAAALPVVRDHPAMLLRPEHFAALRINWRSKAVNLAEIAEELNLGLDSLVFLDDSPHERELVRRTLPQVTVVDLPADPSEYPALVAGLPYFDTLSITTEDRRRSDLYQREQQRRGLRQKATSLGEFLHGLEMRVTVRRAGPGDLSRLAQLTQKTNQFNLTTRRYSLGDLQRLAAEDNWRLYLAEAADRLGDSGVVGAALVELDRPRARLDTFLVSCRVLGRGVETAFLAGLLADLRGVLVEELEAEFLPTPRNGPAQSFLPDQGFEPRGGALVLSLTGPLPACPDWIQLRSCEEDSCLLTSSR